MRKIVSLLSVLMLICALAYSQTREIRGKVTDENGNPVPFATVLIKGTTLGTSADPGGNFTIRAKTGDVLVISSQGHANQEVTVGTGSVVNATLTTGATSTLTEVVVTGAYGTRRTARSTSVNAQVVTGEQLNVVRQPNINNALAGKVSGLQVRSQSAAALDRQGTARLRGESGLGGGGGIIYVVDGTILPNANDINLDDIEDVTVLQGPAASAQFGSAGANGAIVITLKSGKRTRGVGVEVNLGAQFDRVYVLPNYQNAYAGGNSADLKRYTWQPGQPDEWKALDGKYYPNYSDDASWGPRMVGQEYIPWYAWYGGTRYSYKTAYLTPQEDNARDFFNTGVMLNNTVSFSKATDIFNIRLSYGNVNIKGLLPTSSLNKNTLNLKSEVNILPKLIFGANINFVSQKVEGEINDDYSNQSSGSFNQWFHRDIDMNIMKELKNLKTPEGIYASWNHNDPDSYDPNDPRGFYAGNYWYNFYTWFDLAKTYNNRDRVYGDLSLTYKITKDLSLKGTYRRQQNFTWFEEKFASDLALSGTQTTGNEPRAKGYYATSESNSNSQSVNFLANFSRKVTNDISLNLNAGTDLFHWRYKQNGGHTNEGLNASNLFSLQNSKSAATLSNDRIEEKYRAILAFGNIGFRNMLFGEFSLRNDWYSTLPEDHNDVLSKSFGASFVFSDLVKNVAPWLSFGKIRAAWGEIPQALGTSATTFGAYRSTFNYGVNQFQWNGNFLMGTPNELIDSSIHGAVKTQKEAGIELRFLKNRLGITATYWDGTEKDLPLSVATNGASGFTSKLINSGEITKKGIDLQFSARPVSFDNFKWEINATWGRLLENKVVSIYPGINRISVEGVWGSTAPYMVHEVGKDWGQIYGNGIKRIDGKPVLTTDGLFVNDPNVFFGSVLPDYTGGVQNTFQIFKDFTVNVNIDYQKGGKFVSLSDMWGSYSGLTARTATINDKGNPIRDAVADGGGVHVFGVDANNKAVDYYVEAQDYFHSLYDKKAFDEFVYDLTFVKLRELSIGYNIPVNKLKIGNWAQRATVSLVARNPILIYAETEDFDPSEISNVSGERGNFPGTRSFGINLRVGF